ncbi:MAG: hypothetical protein IJH20_06530 [Bacilli bacterium]|nr:hypothetical protein [Bacilli bacterium]
MKKIVEQVNDLMKDLQKIESKYLYKSELQNIFEVAIYLYGRYGEIPVEIENDDDLRKISRIINRYDTLMNENINDNVEDIIGGNDYED